MCAYQPLLGFRDFYPKDQRILNYLSAIVRQVASNFGFEEYSSPILEPLELFTAKSGDEIVNQLFNFVDKGGRSVALRPEMTPSVARMIGANYNTLKKPIKWFNIAENFRYERPQKGRLRAFYQFNLDIFGEASCYADAEIILLIISIMRRLGLEDFYVRLSDRQLWSTFLHAIKIPDETIMPVLAIIDKSEREKSEKIQTELAKICPEYANLLYMQILELKQVHAIDDLYTFLKKYNLAEDSNIRERINKLEELVNILSDFGVSDYVTIDFGIVRGLAYYTGFVFEVFDRALSTRALAGGGRYDALTEKLGYQNIPAVGAAIGDVTLIDFLKRKARLPYNEKKLDCFVIFEQDYRLWALQVIDMLRKSDISTDFLMRTASFDKQFKAAISSQACFAIICAGQEKEKGALKIKDLINREEIFIEQDKVVDFLNSKLKIL